MFRNLEEEGGGGEENAAVTTYVYLNSFAIMKNI
jgi:hypothetical protein